MTPKSAGKKLNACFTSFRQNWKTPKRLYEELDKEFHFNYDPCPNDDSLIGFLKPWGERTFCNPPYSEIADWVKHAYEQAQNWKLVVMLIPSRTDTRWWHDYVMKAKEIRFIKGRLRFDDSGNNAPFPSAIVIFQKEHPASPSRMEEAMKQCPRCKAWHFGDEDVCAFCKMKERKS